MDARRADKQVPTRAGERIETLDVIRGVALFGVLLVNVVTAFRESIFEPYAPSPWNTPPDTDVALGHVVSTYFETKALVLFSLLFGIGLAIQHERHPTRIYRRLAGLLAIGLFHLVFIWSGDILVFYAVAGLLTAPLLRLRPLLLLAFAFACFATQLLPIPFPPVFPTLEVARQHVRNAHDIYGHGSFLAVLAFRIREIRPMAIASLWTLPRTLGLFALGAAIARAPFLRPPRNQLAFAAAGLFGIGVGLYATERHQVWAPIILAIGYASVLTLLTNVLKWVAPLGRMALTSYLSQSIVLGALFYGYGLGLFGRIDVKQSIELVIAIYAAQLIASAVWLRYFQFGPVEWLWRSFTYGKRQPFKRRSETPIPKASA